ncbi:MAG: hypothetical protein R3336_02635 [Phycisphaeraceae bacterium]|nr:hypothetical protein [Phycisphaeraceae bacterium]
MHPKLDDWDRRITWWMERWGHPLHRYSLALIFIWFGSLKLLGFKSATSVIAKTVYLGDPAVTVPVLGGWELLIGITLAYHRWVRVALPLLGLRLIGTALAMALQPEVCFGENWLAPTIQGQYLIKDLLLFSAAMVIGGTVREELHPYGED